DIMTKAGWDPRGMIDLFDVLRRESKRDPGAVEVFFSTHPSPEDRIAQLSAAAARLRRRAAPARQPVRDTAAFRAVRARLEPLLPAIDSRGAVHRRRYFLCRSELLRYAAGHRDRRL